MEDVRPQAVMNGVIEMTIEEKALIHFGKEGQSWKTVEEAGEFLQALSKYVNNPNAIHFNNVCEELADLQIMIDQMKYIFTTWEEYHDYKLKRLEGIIGE